MKYQNKKIQAKINPLCAHNQDNVFVIVQNVETKWCKFSNYMASVKHVKKSMHIIIVFAHSLESEFVIVSFCFSLIRSL